MICNFTKFAKRYQVCQYYEKFIKESPEPLHATTYSWQFTSWGIVIMGPFVKATSYEDKYILATKNYFSKRDEATIVRDFTTWTVAEFIWIHIIYLFSIPEIIMAINGYPFEGTALNKLYAKYRMKGIHSSRYHAPVKGLTEAFNKTLYTILEKMVDKNKKTGIDFLKPYNPEGPILEQGHKPRRIRWSSTERLFSRWNCTPIDKSGRPRGDNHRGKRQQSWKLLVRTGS